MQKKKKKQLITPANSWYFSPNSKNSIFGAFPQFFGQKNVFPRKEKKTRKTSKGFPASCQNSEKSKESIPRKQTNRW